MSVRVLLVEDDKELRTTLRQVMQVEGHEVAVAASLADARAQLRHAPRPTPFDLIVLDLGLPDGEGRTLLAEVRTQGSCPVLVISARHDDGQKIALLDDGADDYLVKPFAAGELLARMRVALRHRGQTIQAAITRYSNRGVEVDLTRRTVLREGTPVHLTPNEFKLLARLVRSTGQVRDIAWLTPAGEEMTLEDWDSGFGKSISVFLNGDAIPEPNARGERVTDDSFLLCFNAHDEALDFVMPGEDYGASWAAALDTADPHGHTELVAEAGATISLQARSLLVLRKTA